MNIIAFIPARGGSRRVPNKNILPLGGKPLISYTIEAAQKAKHITRVVVSTDSSEIAAVSKECGAEVPFLRPPEISTADSTEMQFFEHALKWFSENERYCPDLIVSLYPTTPFRKSESIQSAVDLILKFPEADSLRSVRLCSEHPYKMWRINNNRLLPFVDNLPVNSHTQAYHLLPTTYIQNASIYITKPNTILEKHSTTGDIIIPFIMDDVESIDINTPLDFKFAEVVLSNKS